ncbi:hypothetical protein [Neisseria zoodegmatis]|uniref:hypothetical protein n=1 Tax=Neisseria zoodegmatis TaxID=326523 RepID=UPI00117C2CAE|nr:hypothetical protein [Neisseria zoodegmatis]
MRKKETFCSKNTVFSINRCFPRFQTAPEALHNSDGLKSLRPSESEQAGSAETRQAGSFKYRPNRKQLAQGDWL